MFYCHLLPSLVNEVPPYCGVLRPQVRITIVLPCREPRAHVRSNNRQPHSCLTSHRLGLLECVVVCCLATVAFLLYCSVTPPPFSLAQSLHGRWRGVRRTLTMATPGRHWSASPLDVATSTSQPILWLNTSRLIPTPRALLDPQVMLPTEAPPIVLNGYRVPLDEYAGDYHTVGTATWSWSGRCYPYARAYSNTTRALSLPCTALLHIAEGTLTITMFESNVQHSINGASQRDHPRGPSTTHTMFIFRKWPTSLESAPSYRHHSASVRDISTTPTRQWYKVPFLVAMVLVLLVMKGMLNVYLPPPRHQRMDTRLRYKQFMQRRYLATLRARALVGRCDTGPVGG